MTTNLSLFQGSQFTLYNRQGLHQAISKVFSSLNNPRFAGAMPPPAPPFRMEFACKCVFCELGKVGGFNDWHRNECLLSEQLCYARGWVPDRVTVTLTAVLWREGTQLNPTGGRGCMSLMLQGRQGRFIRVYADVSSFQDTKAQVAWVTLPEITRLIIGRAPVQLQVGLTPELWLICRREK